MTPTKTADPAAQQMPLTRMPLTGDPEDAAIDEACRDLRLPAFRERFVELATTARREQSTYKQFLLDLLQVEVADRDVRRQQRLVRSAKSPRPKRLEDFAFEKNPNVSPEVIADLKSPSWVREGRPLVLIGDSGTGKSRPARRPPKPSPPHEQDLRAPARQQREPAGLPTRSAGNSAQRMER